MKRLVALLMVLISTFTTITFVAAENYEFLDGMALTELEALQAEVENCRR